MAGFKYMAYLAWQGDEMFDHLHSSDHVAPVSGIYRCSTCDLEVAAIQGEPFPSVRHRGEHGELMWNLIVAAG